MAMIAIMIFSFAGKMLKPYLFFVLSYGFLLSHSSRIFLLSRFSILMLCIIILVTHIRIHQDEYTHLIMSHYISSLIFVHSVSFYVVGCFVSAFKGNPMLLKGFVYNNTVSSNSDTEAVCWI